MVPIRWKKFLFVKCFKVSPAIRQTNSIRWKGQNSFPPTRQITIRNPAFTTVASGHFRPFVFFFNLFTRRSPHRRARAPLEHDPLEIAVEQGHLGKVDDTRNPRNFHGRGGRAVKPVMAERVARFQVPASCRGVLSWTHLSCQSPKILRGNEHVGEDNGLGVWS